MPNQLNTTHKEYFCLRDIIPFLCSYYEFDKNANSISMNAEMLFVLNWFGDYRSLRFLCGYFGSRTFYFYRQKGENMKNISMYYPINLHKGVY